MQDCALPFLLLRLLLLSFCFCRFCSSDFWFFRFLYALCNNYIMAIVPNYCTLQSTLNTFFRRLPRVEAKARLVEHACLGRGIMLNDLEPLI